MTGKSFVKALHLCVQSVFINIDRNFTALFNQIKTWRNVREYRKANQKFEINFVNHEILLKIKKNGYIQTDEGGVNEQYKSNKNKR